MTESGPPTREDSFDPSPDYIDPVIEFYKKDVDRALLRENLKLTIDQRIEKFEAFWAFAQELRAAGRRLRNG